MSVNAGAAVVPNLTFTTVVNRVPVMVTWLPPDTGPLVRATEVMVGRAGVIVRLPGLKVKV